VHQPRYTVALTAADVGERVMVRYALAADSPGGSYTDAVGDLRSWADGRLLITTRHGTVDVPQDAVVAGKLVPPRRLTNAGEASVAEVQRMSALSWQALETERLGGWRLRAGGGFTGRANSVLPLGEPGRPLDDALDHVTRWYADRGLLPRFQLPQPDTAQLSQALAARGWSMTDSADVLLGEVAEALELAGDQRGDLPPVRVEDLPSDAWLAAYHYRGGTLPAEAVRILTHHSDVGFASVVEDRAVVAIARATVDGRWLGFQAVEVDPSARRRGLGRQVMSGLLRWGRDRGARHAHLQVAVDNEPGHALYAGLGFTFHHRYDYRMPP
jgi:GNAT superfamily N-acetyltransferase